MIKNKVEDPLLERNLEKVMAQLLEQEQTLVFDTFSFETAHKLGEQLYQTAYARKLPVAIDISRCGQQLYHAALPGSTADNDAWILRKSNVVMRFGHSSYYWGLYLEKSELTLVDNFFLDPYDFAAHGGAFPIILKDTGVIGTITVSGLPSEADHALVVEILESYFK